MYAVQFQTSQCDGVFGHFAAIYNGRRFEFHDGQDKLPSHGIKNHAYKGTYILPQRLTILHARSIEQKGINGVWFRQ